ncbi:MAG: hypothetical protein PVF07_04835 [Thiogranum sp.]|jgi:hypothetical protein
MSRIDAVLKLKELAEEDIYFARLDRDIIAKLHEKAAADEAHSEREPEPAKPRAAGDGQSHRANTSQRRAD